MFCFVSMFQVAPEGSYIDASLYSPKELALLLRQLSRPDRVDDLMKYHTWKSVFQVYSSPRDLSLCQLCSYMNQKTETHRHYPDMKGWWVDKAGCKPRGSHAWSKPESWVKNAINVAKETWSKLPKL